MASSAGKVGTGNQGQVDTDRGSVKSFPYSKGNRNTGKVTEGSSTSNPNDVPGNQKPVSDPRLA